MPLMIQTTAWGSWCASSDMLPQSRVVHWQLQCVVRCYLPNRWCVGKSLRSRNESEKSWKNGQPIWKEIDRCVGGCKTTRAFAWWNSHTFGWSSSTFRGRWTRDVLKIAKQVAVQCVTLNMILVLGAYDWERKLKYTLGRLRPYC